MFLLSLLLLLLMERHPGDHASRIAFFEGNSHLFICVCKQCDNGKLLRRNQAVKLRTAQDHLRRPHCAISGVGWRQCSDLLILYRQYMEGRVDINGEAFRNAPDAPDSPQAAEPDQPAAANPLRPRCSCKPSYSTGCECYIGARSCKMYIN